MRSSQGSVSGRDGGFHHSMRNDYHVEFTRGKLRDIVHGRILMLSAKEVDEFLPDSDWLHVNDFVMYVQKMVRQQQFSEP